MNRRAFLVAVLMPVASRNPIAAWNDLVWAEAEVWETLGKLNKAIRMIQPGTTSVELKMQNRRMDRAIKRLRLAWDRMREQI